MRQIEIRLDPALVESLMETIKPVIGKLGSELAIPAELPEDDELMEDFWKNDLLNSQREELEVVSELFGDEFMRSGRAVIDPQDMDKVVRACSAIRLKLRETMLSQVSDRQLEEGDLEGVKWTDVLQIGYAAYALFASLQELVIAQISNPDPSEEADPDALDWGDDEDLEDER